MSESKEWMTPQDKWQRKAGYKVKGFKLKEDLIEEFEDACVRNETNPTAQVRKMMEEYIKETNNSYQL